jgi:hypothetical protein
MPALPWGPARFCPLKAAEWYRWDFPLPAETVELETSRPGILVERPQNLSSLAEHAPNATEQDGFRIGEMVQDESH